MQLSINHKSIVLSISPEHIHYKTLEHFIRKNFTKVLRTSNSVIILHTLSEQTKRNYMLRWIKNIVKTGNKIQNLEAYENFPLKIVHTQKEITKNIPIHFLKISIKLLQNRRLLFLFEDENKKIIQKFLSFFSDANAKTMYDGKAVLIEITSKETLKKLKQMLAVRTINFKAVQFVYTKSKMHSFLQNLKEKDEAQKILVHSYQVLGSKQGANMQQIRQNYKQLLKKYHPDRVYAENNNKISFYTKKFQQIQSAYDTIQKFRAS